MTVLPGRGATVLLALLCLLQVAAVVGYWQFSEQNGYLPTPFVYDKADTFMDFFHVLYWADHPGRYTDWGSVYPPINFLLMQAVKWVAIGPTDFGDGFEMRAYAGAAIWVLVAIYAAVPLWLVSTGAWRGLTPLQRLLAFVFIVLSPPLLFGLERGNIIVLALGFVALAMARPGWTRIVAIAILINIKPYFALLLLTYVVTGRFAHFVAAVVAAGAIFLASGLLLDPNFLLFLKNLLNFSQADVLFSGREVLALPSSVAAFAYALNVVYLEGGRFEIAGIGLQHLANGVMVVNYAVLAAALGALVLAGRRMDEAAIIAVILVATSNLGVWIGGYSLIMYPALIPVFLTMRHRWFYIGAVVALLMPLDAIVIAAEVIGFQQAYLSGTRLEVIWQLGLGGVVRPTLNFALLLVLTVEMVAGLEFLRRRPLASPKGVVTA